MGRGDESLIAKSRSHDLFYGKVNFGNIGFHMGKGENKLLQPET